MKAKCPYCEVGCARCNLGFINVTFPSGPGVRRYSLICSCGCIAGGGFCGGGYGSADPAEILKRTKAVCPLCGKDDNIRVEIPLREEK